MGFAAEDTAASTPIVREPGDGMVVEALGAHITIKAMCEQTSGRYGCIEYLAPAGFRGPIRHIHPGFDEVFYVLEGEFTFQLGAREVRVGAGAFVHVPGATPHTFANPGHGPAKFVGFAMPGGQERFFLELPDLIARHGYPPPPSVMTELTQKYGVEAVP